MIEELAAHILGVDERWEVSAVSVWVEIGKKGEKHVKKSAEIAAGNGNPEHWRWWIQNRKAKLKQERKQPPAEVDKFLPEEAWWVTQNLETALSAQGGNGY